MNLAAGDWDDELLRSSDVPRAMLPRIVPSSRRWLDIPTASIFGSARFRSPVSPAISRRRWRARRVSRAGLSKNTTARDVSRCCMRAAYGAGVEEPACWRHARGIHRRRRSLPWKAACSSPAPRCSGCATSWGSSGPRRDRRRLPRAVPDTGGVYVVPAFVGLGRSALGSGRAGRHHRPDAGTGRAQIVRAALESIAYQTRELIDAMEADSRARPCANCAWMAARR